MSGPEVTSRRRRLARLAAPALLAASMLAGPVAARAQTVTIAQGNDPTSLDPAYDTSIYSRSIMTNIYDTLVWRSPTGDVLPSLAESWKFLDDTTLELKLRRGVKFQDGEVLSADDVIFSAERYLDKKNPKPLRSYLAGLFERIEKVDDHTIIMHLAKPNATILGQFARMPILPEKGFKRLGESRFGTHPIGTGPFKVVRWDKNEQLVLEAFKDHWRGAPSFERLVFKPIPEDFARFAALKTGEVDIVANLPPERVASLRADPNLKVATVSSARQIHVAMNTTIKPYSDVRVRRALNYAVNVQEIVDTVLGGHAYPNPALCGRALWGYDPDIKPYGYDPAKARALLAEAGYPHGFETKLLAPTARYMKDREVAQAIAGQLARVGIKVELVTPEWADFLDRVFTRGKYKHHAFPGMYLLGTGGPTLDCGRTLLYRIYSKGRLVYYRTDETKLLDQLVEKQKVTLDPDARRRVMYRIQEIVHDDAPWIFLYDQQDLYGLRKRIEWQPRPDEFIWAYDIKVKG